MRQYSDRPLLFLLLLLSSFACVIPEFISPQADAIRTASAQTVIAQLTQSISLSTVSPSAPTSTVVIVSPTFTASFTPSFTPTITLSPTSAYTPTALIAQITVSVDTNCRVGPGRVYPRVGALLIGEIADVYGRDPTGRYWYIRNPDAADGFCWVWSEYATLTGPYLSVPVFTPPPTPTPTFTPTFTVTPTPQPDFAIDYEGKDTCAGWWLEVRLRNTGSTPFRSVIFDMDDLTTNQNQTALSDGFVNVDGCSKTTTKDVLVQGNEFVISSPVLSYDPTGHEMVAHITLCSQPGQKGDCVKKKVKFTP